MRDYNNPDYASLSWQIGEVALGEKMSGTARLGESEALMTRCVVSFHNHLPAVLGRRGARLHELRARQVLERAFRLGIDVLCINQWATMPHPFLYAELLLAGRIPPFEAEDHGVYLVVRRGNALLLLLRGLEVGVRLEDGTRGEFLLMGVTAQYPLHGCDLPGYRVSSELRGHLGDLLMSYVTSEAYWLLVAPHPLAPDGLGCEAIARLHRQGVLDTFEEYNAALALVAPACNRSFRAVGEALRSPGGGSLRGICGNDGVDAASIGRSTTLVELPSGVAESDDLLDRLATAIRSGQVANHCSPLSLSGLFHKVMNSRRKAGRLARILRGPGRERGALAP